MVDIYLLRRAMLVCAVFELLLVVAAHFSPWLRLHFLLFGCMMIAGVMGLLYGRDLARGFRLGALGGGVIGAVGGVVAVGANSILGGKPEDIPFGVMLLAVVGAIGGLFGQFDAMLRKLIRSLGKSE